MSGKVYTYGVFDLLHVGHLELLEEARELGGYLVVGVFTDDIAMQFKREPVIPLEQRMAMLHALYCVNEVIVQDKFDPDDNLRKVKPEVLCKGPGANWGEDVDKLPGASVMEELGGRTVLLKYHEGQSTSAIIEKIKSL